MQRYNLSFRNKTFPQQLAVLEKLVANAGKLTAEAQQNITALADFRAQTAAAGASHARIASLRADLKAELTRRKTLFAAARSDASRVGNGLAAAVDWQPAAMQGVGLELPAPNTTRVGLPGAPDHFTAVPTDNEGEARLRWKHRLTRCVFEVQWHSDPPDANCWEPEAVTARHSFVIKGLVSGKKYWFRVRANHTAGPGPWSQLVCVRVK